MKIPTLSYDAYKGENSSKITEIGNSLIAAGATSELSKASPRKQIFLSLP